MKLGRLDSNQDYQGQNLACCQLHYGPRTVHHRSKGSSDPVYEPGICGASANILRGSISQYTISDPSHCPSIMCFP